MEGFLMECTKENTSFESPPKPSSSKPQFNFVMLSPENTLTNVTTPTNRPFRVSIEGNIGAGKSTMIKYFSSFPEIETYAEPVDCWRNLDGHNLLDLLYNDRDLWYTPFQMYVWLTLLKVQTSSPKRVETTVQMFERSVQGNRHCFVEQAKKCGLLKTTNYYLMDQWYKWARTNCDLTIDLIVYLRSTPEKVHERIKQRGRPEETGVTLDFLRELHDVHEQWLMSGDSKLNKVPVLVLDADKTLQEIEAEYKTNKDKILGHEKREMRAVDQKAKDRVKKNLQM